MARALHASSQRADRHSCRSLRRAVAGAVRERAVRPREGRVHQRRGRQAGLLETADAARCSSTRSASCRKQSRSSCCACSRTRRAPRRRRPADQARRAVRRRDQPRPRGRGRARPISPGPVLRLSGVALVVPPLRHRRDEIEPLARTFCDEAAARAGRPAPALSPRRSLRSRPTRGPAHRELRNMIERATALCNGAVIEPDDLPLDKIAATLPLASARRPAPPPARIDDDTEKARIIARSPVQGQPDPRREPARLLAAQAGLPDDAPRAAAAAQAQGGAVTEAEPAARRRRPSTPRPCRAPCRRRRHRVLHPSQCDWWAAPCSGATSSRS